MQETRRTEIRLTRISVFSEASLQRKAWKRSRETAEDVTSSCEELVLMIAARIADQMMPVMKGAESDSAIRTKTRSAFAFSSGVVRYALPMTPMAMAKARDRMTHVMAMCVDFFRSLASEIAMNLTRICGCPK